jgi:threonine/homoserine/homoserine lactone efflux protein
VQLTTLGTFVLLEIVLCFIPGPAVMAVVSSALTGRSQAGMATAFGILTGNLIYFLVSALGTASVLLASHAAFFLVKWCGAAYLAYLGIRAIFTRTSSLHDASAELLAMPSRVRGWLSGTVTQLANPKAIVFFGAILPQFIDPRGNVILQESVLGVAALTVELVVLSIYVWSAERVRSRGVSPAAQTWAQRAGGVIMLAVAAGVARGGV